MEDVVIVSAARTPVGAFSGAFATLAAHKLGEVAIRAALEHPGPALLSVKVARHELSMSPTIDFEQAKGFSIYLVKAMLNGKGDEILDLERPICALSFKAAGVTLSE